MLCQNCFYAKQVPGSVNNYICQAFPQIIGLVKGHWRSTTDCIDIAKTSGGDPDALEVPEGSSIVLRTFWNEEDEDAGGYWDTVSEPKPKPNEESILVTWTSPYTGHTTSLDTGSRYEFYLDKNGCITSESPAYQKGNVCKHQVAIANSFEVRPVDSDDIYVPF